jgi:hypothetical protein
MEKHENSCALNEIAHISHKGKKEQSPSSTPILQTKCGAKQAIIFPAQETKA